MSDWRDTTKSPWFGETRAHNCRNPWREVYRERRGGGFKDQTIVLEEKVDSEPGPMGITYPIASASRLALR